MDAVKFSTTMFQMGNNTDAELYTGSGVGNLGAVEAVAGEWSGQPAYADITVPPLASVWFRRRG